MKKVLPAFVLLSVILGCSKHNAENHQLSDIEKIAEAYGISNFDNIEQLQYTFNVDRDSITVVSRTWIWEKESGAITAIADKDTILFKQNKVGDNLKRTDHQFINDKYWLLFPFQLVWDTDMTYENKGSQMAPISGMLMTKLTIKYGAEGGYTPGDAYDLFLDDNWIIREWEFRKSGKESPGSAITWEGYEEINGIKVATDHYNKDGLRIYFTDIKFK